jgi:TRAP-type uncharacterized transport system fused permease subunit
LTAVFAAVVGLTACSIALTGYFRGELHLWERAILLLGGLGLIHKGIVTDIVGIAILALFLFWKMRKPAAVQNVENVVISEEVSR